MKKIWLVFLSILIFASFISCNRDFSRSQAKKKLPTKISVVTRSIDHRYGDDRAIILDRDGQMSPASLRILNKIESLLNRLRQEGYVTYEKDIRYGAIFSQSAVFVSYNVAFTNKLKRFIIEDNKDSAKVIIAEEVVDDVTGITKAPMDENGRLVVFTTKVLPNQLSKIFPLTNTEKGSRRREAYFRKYDDGWRLLRL